MKKVKVKDFRSTTDHLLRLANYSFSCCKGADELSGWVSQLDNALARARLEDCARAGSDDLEWRSKAYEQCGERRNLALVRIEKEKGNHLSLV